MAQVVEAIRLGEAKRAEDVPSVDPVSPDTDEQIREYVTDYGETLVALPEASWDTSIAIWLNGYWEVAVDLWTEAEGRSDLVLHMQVREAEEGYRFQVGMVYVP